MSELDAATYKHIEHIVLEERRAYCVLDFRCFEIDGKEYTMTSGTFRNKNRKLAKEGQDMRIIPYQVIILVNRRYTAPCRGLPLDWETNTNLQVIKIATQG